MSLLAFKTKASFISNSCVTFVFYIILVAFNVLNLYPKEPDPQLYPFLTALVKIFKRNFKVHCCQIYLYSKFYFQSMWPFNSFVSFQNQLNFHIYPLRSNLLLQHCSEKHLQKFGGENFLCQTFLQTQLNEDKVN